jgi:hypothetical protein
VSVARTIASSEFDGTVHRKDWDRYVAEEKRMTEGRK